LDGFAENLSAAIGELRNAGVRPALLTIAPPGPDIDFPVNAVFKAYSRAIRAVAQEHELVLIDLERAFQNIYDRATNYKQKVALSGPRGELNAQGQSLVARSFLGAFGLLPMPGQRGLRG
jgi:hypothetical protein